MNYFYTISYDEKQDDFYGVIDIMIQGKNVELFSIDTTAEMCDYIATGVMKHIDDVDGLENFLKQQQYLSPEDNIIMVEATLY